MRTFADVKRRMLPGTRLEVLEQTKRPVLAGTMRTIIETTSAGLRFTSSNTGDEDYRQSWPKASVVRILDADTFEYDYLSDCTIRLRFI